MTLPKDILNYISKEFSKEELHGVILLLENAKKHDGATAEPRLLRCALVASKSTINGLRYQIDGLAHDYRDVILDAEYIKKKGKWVQIRDLSKPFETNTSQMQP